MSDPIAVLRVRVQRAKRLYEVRQSRHRAGDPRITKEMVLAARDKFRRLRAQLQHNHVHESPMR
jgi:hypothetical protein